MRRFLIDTDTASDDAVALVMAARHPDIQIEAVTVVCGNVPLDQAVQNGLYALELCDKAIPVYAGAAKPLLRPLHTAQIVHGVDGMGDMGLPLHGRAPAAGHAVDVIRRVIRQHAGDITLVTLGPLTNIAIALLCEPELAGMVSDCYIMGGIGSGHGNVTPVAEFNIWCDPEAAKIVFESGMKMTMVGWDISWKYATFGQEDAAALRAIGTPLAAFAVDIQATLTAFALKETHLAGFDLPDPIAMAVALDPTIANIQPYHVDITTGDGLNRGQTVVDVLGMTGQPPNIEVVTSASRERFLDILYASVR